MRHLRYFTAVAEELHFERAAERLHMAQPPLSQHILNLERELGVKLFARTKRKVELTDAGRVFLAEVRLILSRTEQAIHNAQRASRGEFGRLIVGFVLSATCSLIPSKLNCLVHAKRSSCYPASNCAHPCSNSQSATCCG